MVPPLDPTLTPFRAITSVTSQPVGPKDSALEARHLFEAVEARFETTVPALAALSRDIEREALNRRIRYGELFVGFQRLSRFVPSVAERYLSLADYNQVYIFGYDDGATLPYHPHLCYVALDRDDPLCAEWFVIVNSPDYQTAFGALDLVGFDQVEDVNNRSFVGAKINNPVVVEQLASNLRGRVPQE